MTTLIQAPPVSAKGPSDELVFSETRFDVARVGHVSLSWNSIEAAAEYVVSDSQGDVPYRGAFPQAFVSGLSDGTYTFTVTAFDENGQQIATSAKPAIVLVQHWPLWQAMTLLGIGLIVFLVIISLIWLGWRSDRAELLRASLAAGEPGR